MNSKVKASLRPSGTVMPCQSINQQVNTMNAVQGSDAQIEQLRVAYFSAKAHYKTYHRRASEPFHAHKCEYYLNKAAEYKAKVETLGRLLDKHAQ